MIAAIKQEAQRMISLDIYQAVRQMHTVIPMAILLIEDEDGKMLLSQLYIDHRKLMFAIAKKYMGTNKEDLDEVISSTIERMCKYYTTIRDVPPPKREAYIATITSNVCRDLLRKKKRKNELFDYTYTKEKLEEIPEEEDCYKSVFDEASAQELESAFDGLSQRERTLIYMHHIDGLEVKKIAAELNISYGAARTALSRARNRLIEIARRRKNTDDKE